MKKNFPRYIFGFIIFISLTNKAISQQNITLKAKCHKLRLQQDSIKSGFLIALVVTNSTKNNVVVPSKTRGVAQNSYHDDEIGLRIRELYSKKEINCEYDINYGVLPQKQIIKPHEKGMIEVIMLGDWFYKMGKYKVTFYLKNNDPDSMENAEIISNSLIINIR